MNVSVTPEKIASTRRMLDAARTLVADGGAAALSTGDVASVAGVSKALVHYHFRDKDTLLVELVRQVGNDVVARETSCLDVDSSAPIDAYWDWLRAELRAGDVRVLLALTPGASDTVRGVLETMLTRRRALAARHVGGIFSRLGLKPHVNPQVLGDAMVAMVDGLALAATLEPDRDPRPAFDALWLALLTLAEND